MAFHPRSEWATVDIVGRGVPLAGKGVEAAVVHHTVGQWTPGTDKAQWLRNLEAAVMRQAPGNSGGLSAIDYNEMIFPDGDVWEGRGLVREDAATLRFNGQSASWALVGNYDVSGVPDAMVRALAQRIKYAEQRGFLRANPRILGHGEVGTFATACPGRFMRDRLPEVRALVAAGGPTEENDEMADAATQLLLTDVIERLKRLEDMSNHVLNDIIPGGYAKRAGIPGAQKYRLTDTLERVRKIETKVGA